jgi:hypothetical protein
LKLRLDFGALIEAYHRAQRAAHEDHRRGTDDPNEDQRPEEREKNIAALASPSPHRSIAWVVLGRNARGARRDSVPTDECAIDILRNF